MSLHLVPPQLRILPDAWMDRVLAKIHLADEVNRIGPHVSKLDIAVALRGRGFVLVEMGQLDEAETAFEDSLELDPNNPIALNELQYVEHLRAGGPSAPLEAVPRPSTDIFSCVACGKRVTGGVVVNVDGAAVSICRKCHGKLTKKWWQFWK